jgi:hypothetical protein
MTRLRGRFPARVLVVGAVVAAGLVLTSPPSGSQSAGAQAPQAHVSLRDRVVSSDARFGEFKDATSVPSRSPALADARRDDTVVRSDRLVEPSTMAAVILRPRGSGTAYRIPRMPARADAFAFLTQHLERAADRGASRITFPRGTVFEIDRAAPIRISGLSDVDIDLNGSTIRLTQQSVAFRIDDSRRVVLRDGRIEGAGHLASIAEVSLDGSGRPSFAVLPASRSVTDGDPAAPPELHTVGLAQQRDDGRWELKPDRYTEMFTNRGASTNNYRYESGSYVPTSPVSPDMALRDGDMVWLLHENNTAPGILLDNEEGIEDISLVDLTLANIPGMGIVGEVQRGLHIDGLRMEVAEGPLAIFATSSDGVHINANGGDIVIENSYLGPNADDKVTIKGNYWRVTDVDRASRTVEVAPAGRKTSVRRWGFAGQRLVFVDDSFGVVATAALAADSREDDDRHVLRLDDLPAGVRRGALIANVDNGGGRVVIRNNVFESTRAQGILVQTQHVVVEDNEFDAIAGPPIRLNMGLTQWFEGVNTDNVLVVDNVFGRSGRTLGDSGDLIEFRQNDAAGTPIRIIGNVRIVDNTRMRDDAAERAGAVWPHVGLLRQLVRGIGW